MNDVNTTENPIKLSDLRENLKSAALMLKTCQEVLMSMISSLGMNPEKTAAKLSSVTDEYISSCTSQELSALVSECNGCEESIPALSSSECANYRAQLVTIKKEINTYEGIKKGLDDTTAEYHEAITAENKYYDSPEYKESQLEKLKQLNTELSTTNDPARKAQIENVLATYNALEALKFFFCEFDNDDKRGALVRGFMDSKRGQYVLDRYGKRCGAFGVQFEMYNNLLHIECKFLPEKYHVYNNFFIYIIISMIAYGKPYNELYTMTVKKMILNCNKLMFNGFGNSDSRDGFISVICKSLDEFEHYRDEFDAGNTSYHKYKETTVTSTDN